MEQNIIQNVTITSTSTWNATLSFWYPFYPSYSEITACYLLQNPPHIIKQKWSTDRNKKVASLRSMPFIATEASHLSTFFSCVQASTASKPKWPFCFNYVIRAQSWYVHPSRADQVPFGFKLTSRSLSVHLKSITIII